MAVSILLGINFSSFFSILTDLDFHYDNGKFLRVGVTPRKFDYACCKISSQSPNSPQFLSRFSISFRSACEDENKNTEDGNQVPPQPYAKTKERSFCSLWDMQL